MCFWWLMPCRHCGEGMTLGHGEEAEVSQELVRGEGGLGGSSQGVG